MQQLAIERGDGPVVEVRLDGELSVVVLPSRRSRRCRRRYGSAGNKDNRLDAYLLADRSAPTATAGRRVKIIWTPKRCERCAGPARISWRPGCRCSTRSAQIWSCPCPDRCACSTTGQQDHPGVPDTVPDCGQGGMAVTATPSGVAGLGRDTGGRQWPRSTSASPCGSGPHRSFCAARGRITLGLVSMVEALNDEIEQIEQQISQLFDMHPDERIFTSLPRSGMVRARVPAGRDRRLSATVPHRRRTGRAGRGVAVHPVRQARPDRLLMVLNKVSGGEPSDDPVELGLRARRSPAHTRALGVRLIAAPPR